MSISPDLKLTTLCLIRDGSRVLLGMKKRGFGAGRWNGFGGKVKVPETIEAATLRELTEESGIIAQDLRPCGLLHFDFENDQTKIDCHVFTVTTWTGEPAETEEMAPRWFSIDQIPFAEMWPDDIHWFPLFLTGKNFEASFTFKADQKTILKQEINERD